MKKAKYLVLLPVWVICSLVFAAVCISTILYAMESSSRQVAVVSAQPTTNMMALPQGEVKGISTVYETGDARGDIVNGFLERYKSPVLLEDPEFGYTLVEIADKYGLDYRLLPAIAMQESNLCKVIPSNSFNCLGFGVHSRGTMRFENFESNFDTAAKTLKTKYVDIGLTTPEKIMTKYTPSSNGSWAASVNQWIAEMEYNDRALGKELKTDADLTKYGSPSAKEL